MQNYNPTKETREQKNNLIKAKSGNIAAFENIFTKYERDIFKYVYSIVRQKQDAEDITQEIFIKLYKNLKAVDPERNFKSYLFTMASNSTIDWIRSKGRKKEILMIDAPDRKNIQNTLIKKESLEKTIQSKSDLWRAIKNINPMQQITLILFYAEGLKYKEIASFFVININTVKTYIQRGKKALKKELEKA